LNEPRLYVVAAPSGGGNTSLINALLKKDDQIQLSVSFTTRPSRPGEVEGVHYHFVDEASFQTLIDRNAFLEYACVFDYLYGTSREAVEQQLAAGFDVILDIDWQGARQIRNSFPSSCSIFIVPLSLDALRHRLIGRGQDSDSVIQRRMRDAQAEISHWDEFNFLIINDNFDQALCELHSIIKSGTLRHPHDRQHYGEILAELLGTG
jgi:guanylate kinase